MARAIHKFLAAVLPGALLAGCSRTSSHEKFALDGVRKLREQHNSGTCRIFHDQTQTRRDQDEEVWFRGCQRMREDLGSWQSFAETMSSSSSRYDEPPTVRVEGLATFEDGDHWQSYRLESYWHINNGRARLYFLYLEGGGKEIALPHLPKASPGPRDVPSKPPIDPAVKYES